MELLKPNVTPSIGVLGAEGRVEGNSSCLLTIRVIIR